MANSEIQSHKSAFYHRLSGWYEPLFARFFRDRARGAIRGLNIPPGAEVLEIGCGTGLALAAYPAHAHVTGCDLSEEMLERAREKVAEKGWQHIRLLQMDAQDLKFPDESFDYVMAFHVVTVVPDHRQLVREMVRVAKPQATILIVNHFRSHRVWLAKLIDVLDPVTRHLGWRTTLSLEEVIAGEPLRVKDRYKTAPQSLFNVVVLEKTGEPLTHHVPAPCIRKVPRRSRQPAGRA
jgi:phosphatidylethanolamine/phosphatidyl-N-methylethanolamine N-methyltransferase